MKQFDLSTTCTPHRPSPRWVARFIALRQSFGAWFFNLKTVASAIRLYLPFILKPGRQLLWFFFWIARRGPTWAGHRSYLSGTGTDGTVGFGRHQGRRWNHICSGRFGQIWFDAT